MKSFTRPLSIIFIFISLFLALACHAKKPIPKPENIKLPPVQAGQPLPSNLFIELAKKTNPSVVNIYTETKPNIGGFSSNGGQIPDSMQLFLEQFFGGMGGGMRGNPNIQPMQSLGTGFVIRKDGLILTNAHVVDKADVVKVKFQDDNNEYEAQIIGSDIKSDVALIKVKTPKQLPALTLGNSDKLEVGEWVAAFGNPYGHSNTMTKGIISALGRDSGELNLFPFIQTDASINPGNSGGPLVNMKGEVIGMNTAIDARAQGIGFSIPINNIKQILSELEKTGTIQRGFLGIEMHGLDKNIASSLKLPTEKGTLVANVLKGSPADKGGLKPYDVIVNFNGTAIESPSDIQKAVAATPVGKAAKLKVYRNGKLITLDVVVGSTKSNLASAPNINNEKAPESSEAANLKEFGLAVADLDNSLLKRFGLSKSESGVLVTAVAPYSPAFQADIRKGDIILEINRSKVSSVGDFKKKLKNKNLLRVQREQRTILTLMSKG